MFLNFTNFLALTILFSLSYSQDENQCNNCYQVTIRIGCISGEMEFQQQHRGLVKVKDLKEGDYVQGYKGKNKQNQWCKVLSVNQHEKGKTFKGFTEDHMILNKSGTIVANGKQGYIQENEDLYNFATECEIVENTNGDLITPMNQVHCQEELSFEDYQAMYQGMLKVILKTGNFWFDSSIYINNDTDSNQLQWRDKLPYICYSWRLCSIYDDCESFENAATDFILSNINENYRQIIVNAYPNMGSVDEGISKDIKNDDSLFIKMLIIGITGVCIILAIILIVCLRKGKKQQKLNIKENIQESDTSQLNDKSQITDKSKL